MWIITAYYTPGYKKHVNRLIESLKRFGLPNDVQSVVDLGDWYKNTQFKPVFLKQMLAKHYPKSVVYVDADAEVCKYPDYFDYLDNWKNGPDIAVHVLDHSKYGRRDRAPELLSGTIFLRNSPTTSIIIDRWIKVCQKSATLWDQRALASVLQDYQYHTLPEEYCTIFDYMKGVQSPVIKHFQASREFRRAKRHKPITNSVCVVKRKK